MLSLNGAQMHDQSGNASPVRQRCRHLAASFVSGSVKRARILSGTKEAIGPSFLLSSIVRGPYSSARTRHSMPLTTREPSRFRFTAAKATKSSADVARDDARGYATLSRTTSRKTRVRGTRTPASPDIFWRNRNSLLAVDIVDEFRPCCLAYPQRAVGARHRRECFQDEQKIINEP